MKIAIQEYDETSVSRKINSNIIAIFAKTHHPNIDPVNYDFLDKELHWIKMNFYLFLFWNL